MPSFQEMFAATSGGPVVYQGKTLIPMDRFPVFSSRSLLLVIEQANSDWRQGVALKVGSGNLQIDEHAPCNHAVCWQANSPPAVRITLDSIEEFIVVYNVWDTGRGTTQAWHNGAAMIAEDIANGRRYACNDGRPDDDFDDLVFRIERHEGLEAVPGS